jgi:hypothetical protein
MSKSNICENDLLKLIFNATNWSLIADNTGTTPAALLWVSLHTGDPGENGLQSTSETSYTGYTRVSVTRTAAGWTLTATGTMSPSSTISFPQCSGNTATISHFGIGTNGTATQGGYLLYSGTVTPNISVSTGVTPQLTTASTITED